MKKYVCKSRVVARVFFALFVFCVVMGMLENNNEETYSLTNLVPAITFGAVTLIIFIISLFGPKSKEEAERRRQRRRAIRAKRTIGETLAGVLCYALGVIVSMASFGIIMSEVEKAATKQVIELPGLLFFVAYGAIAVFVFGWWLLYGNVARRMNSELLAMQVSEDDGAEGRVNQCLVSGSSDINQWQVDDIDGMEGHEFEYFCADLLVSNGFVDVRVTPGSGDQGVDILAVRDGVSYAIQCKNYSSPLGNAPVQAVNAGKTFYRCHVGVVLTNSTFTKGAVALAEATGVLLWDRTVLQGLMLNCRSGNPTL